MNHENHLRTWKRLSREVVYNSFLKVVRDRVLLPNGESLEYNFIDQGDCACVLLANQKDQIVVIKQYRYVIDEITWEIPMGGILPNERPEDAAKRETLEETGYKLDKLTPLGVIVPSNGQSPQKMHRPA